MYHIFVVELKLEKFSLKQIKLTIIILVEYNTLFYVSVKQLTTYVILMAKNLGASIF